MAHKLKLPVFETDVLYSQIPLFYEAFIIASNKAVMPVVKIDGKKVGSDRVGQITKQLIKAYAKETGKESVWNTKKII